LLVCDFAKKTGDYASLSATDLKVLALQYTLEKEVHGNVEHLRTDIQQPQEHKERPNNFFSPTEVTGKQIGVGKWAEGDDDAGWISPENVEEYKAALAETVDGQSKGDQVFKVACLTLDFAMQNVILQMNMNLVSVDGLAIHTCQKWVKRCLSCRKFVKDMELQYCKNCGSGVLQKLSYTVNKDGSIHYNLPRHKPSLRGTIYPIPLSKGGRNQQFIATPQQLPAKRKQGYFVDVADPELSFLDSKSKHRKPTVVGYGKKNPNQAKRSVGKKNKTLGQQ